MRRIGSFAQALAVTAMLAASPAAAQMSEADRAAGRELAALINAHRVARSLPAVPVSPSLTRVAEAHVLDMAARPSGAGPFDFGSAGGRPCNMHSWSARGPWTPVCYTGIRADWDLMWNKPREITGGVYTGNGYEISAGSSAAITAAGALANWQSSSAHHAVILQQDNWTTPWRAMGVAVHGRFAVAWFGHEPDPAR